MKTTQIAQFFIAGLVYSDVDLSALKLRAGQKLDLVKETANPHDTDAIRIDLNGSKLGYVPRVGRDVESDNLRDAIADGEPVRVEVKQCHKANPSHRMVLVRALVKASSANSSRHAVKSF